MAPSEGPKLSVTPDSAPGSLRPEEATILRLREGDVLQLVFKSDSLVEKEAMRMRASYQKMLDGFLGVGKVKVAAFFVSTKEGVEATVVRAGEEKADVQG